MKIPKSIRIQKREKITERYTDEGVVKAYDQVLSGLTPLERSAYLVDVIKSSTKEDAYLEDIVFEHVTTLIKEYTKKVDILADPVVEYLKEIKDYETLCMLYESKLDQMLKAKPVQTGEVEVLPYQDIDEFEREVVAVQKDSTKTRTREYTPPLSEETHQKIIDNILARTEKFTIKDLSESIPGISRNAFQVRIRLLLKENKLIQHPYRRNIDRGIFYSVVNPTTKVEMTTPKKELESGSVEKIQPTNPTPIKVVPPTPEKKPKSTKAPRYTLQVLMANDKTILGLIDQKNTTLSELEDQIADLHIKDENNRTYDSMSMTPALLEALRYWDAKGYIKLGQNSKGKFAISLRGAGWTYINKKEDKN